jgi:uncharacterized repeat protein (TIGR01451 family)
MWRRYLRRAGLGIGVLLWIGICPRVTLAQPRADGGGPSCKPVEGAFFDQAGAGLYSQPAISADGRHIAFWSTGDLAPGPGGNNADGSIEIFVYDVESAQVTQVTDSPGSILGGFNLAPSINADGTRIAFYSDRNLAADNKDGNFEIFMYDAGVNPPRIVQVTRTTRGVNISPDISGGGQHIAFASDQDLDNKDGNLEIFVAEIGAGGAISLTQVTHTTAGDGQQPPINDRPAISADGARIAFASNQDGNLEIFVYDAGDASMTQVTTTDGKVSNEQPAISADGTRVAFVSNGNLVPGVGNTDGNFEIFVYDAATGQTQQITNTGGEVVNEQPHLNAAGDLLTFVSTGDLGSAGGNPDGKRQGFLFGLAGGDFVQLGSPDADDAHPSISAYGDYIAFDAGREIRLVNCQFVDLSLVKTGPAEVVTGHPLTYTLTVANHGPSPASGVTLVDQLPVEQVSPSWQPLDQTDDDGTEAGFGGGAHHWTRYISTSGWLEVYGSGDFWALPDGATDSGWVSMTGNVLLMHLDESQAFTGTVIADASGRGNGGVLYTGSDSLDKSTTGKLAGALQFDGVDDYVSVGSQVNLSNASFTIAFWAKRNASGRYDYVVGQGINDLNLGLHVGFRDSDEFTCAFYGDDLNTPPYADAGWHHWACSYDAGTKARAIYRDGVRVAQDAALANYQGSGELYLGRSPASLYFGGLVDEVAVFTRTLSAQEIALVHARQAPAYAGYFDSRVMDSYGDYAPAWNSLAWRPQRPLYKALPDGAQAESGYPSGAVNMAGNVLLMHMDAAQAISGALVVDASGQGHHGLLHTAELSTTKSAPGRFNAALRLDGRDDYVAVDGVDFARGDYAVAAWFRSSDPGAQAIFAATNPFDDGHGVLLELGTGGRLRYLHRFPAGNSGGTEVYGGSGYDDGAWHHLAAVRAGATMSLYVDGGLAVTATGVLTSFDYALDITLGQMGEAHSRGYLDGSIDEVAVFGQALTAGQVADLYKRGALRLKFQVRACDDENCQGEAFVGPDGTPDTYYSELSNTSVTPPALVLTNLPTPGARYFQYRALLEADVLDDWPRLEQVVAGKVHYADGTVIASPGVACHRPVSSSLVCDLGHVARDASESVTLSFRVNKAFTGTHVNNTAWVTSSVYERDESNDSGGAVSWVRVVGFESNEYFVSERDVTAAITVTLSAAASLTVTVDYSVTEGTATAGEDYAGGGGQLTFDPGVTRQAFSVSIADDALDEHNETVMLTLADSSSPATLVIEDDDPLPTLRFDPAAYRVIETDTGVSVETITVTLGPESGRVVTTTYATNGGTATADDDYVAIGGTLTFTLGATSQTFTVTVASDNLDEGDEETVGLALLSAPFAAIAGANPATLTIGDDDFAPEVDLNGADGEGVDFDANFVENGGAVSIVDVDLNVADEDDASLISATVALTNHPDAPEEVLTATFTNSISVSYDFDTGILSLSGTDTVTNYQQVLRTVTYNNNSNHPDTADRIITFVANDGTNDSNVATSTVTVGPRNDPPVVDLNGNDPGIDFAATFIEGEGAVYIVDHHHLNVTDVDDSQLASATVTLTNHLNGDDEVLNADTSGTVIVASYDPNTGVLNLSNVESLAHYRQVLRTVTYNNTSQDPDITDRVVEFVVNDGEDDSSTAVCTITIRAVNSPPNAVDDSVTVASGGTVISDVLRNDSDPEGDIMTVTQTSEPGHGTVVLSWNGIFTYTHDGSPAPSDDFTYEVCDSGIPSRCNTATVNITVSLSLPQLWAVTAPLWLSLLELSSPEPDHRGVRRVTDWWWVSSLPDFERSSLERSLPRKRWLMSGRPRGALR